MKKTLDHCPLKILDARLVLCIIYVNPKNQFTEIGCSEITGSKVA